MIPYTKEGYEVRIVALTPLRIGSGARGFISEILRAPVFYGNQLVRVPIIPFSSLKGALRGIAESLAKTLWDKSELSKEVCLRVAASHERRGGKVFHNVNQEDLELIRENIMEEGIFSESEIEEFEDEFPVLLCPICRLFGAPGLAGALRISDAIPSNLDIKTEYLTKTSIDRKKMKVMERRLFRDEVLPPGVEFEAIMVLDWERLGRGRVASIAKDLLEQIMIIARELGIQLGGGKSIGRGKVRIEFR